MWTVIYITPSLRLAENICKRLMAEGFLVKRRQISASKQQFEILVPEYELEDVRESLNDIVHASLSD
ncbi:MAG: glutamate decarboxylase [Acidibacillus sp.]|uniref:Glutamate decarboxylase n=1 Tax=Sulfoacidibacillus ferrooxidans TaxID=2005001 RepID=A0A9X2ADK0_9BACL|nr:glutamate decarboxylase [Sulfoacidibacillus ferrooxidans]MCI0182442.1 hypothetical protein [Sulfoacidibacillus ferrooxidans]MCY0894332.1 glutamate decarboxylase [Acidibacillus sp.]